MLWALAMVSLLVGAGLSRIWIRESALDIQLHDTYFVVAHFHPLLAGAALCAAFGATSFCFPRVFGRSMNDTLGKVHFWLTLVAYGCMFSPVYWIGLAGQMRRINDPYQYAFLQPVPLMNQIITVSALVLAASQLLFLVNFFWSAFHGPKASAT